MPIFNISNLPKMAAVAAVLVIVAASVWAYVADIQPEWFAIPASFVGAAFAVMAADALAIYRRYRDRVSATQQLRSVLTDVDRMLFEIRKLLGEKSESTDEDYTGRAGTVNLYLLPYSLIGLKEYISEAAFIRSLDNPNAVIAAYHLRGVISQYSIEFQPQLKPHDIQDGTILRYLAVEPSENVVNAIRGALGHLHKSLPADTNLAKA